MSAKEDHVENTTETKRKFSIKLTMEIPIILIMFGTFLSGNVVTNILLYRTCINTLGRPESECSAVFQESGSGSNETRDPELENEAQRYVTNVRMASSVLEASFPAIFTLFLGSWSNRYGRKPLMMWPLLGMTISSVLLLGFTAINSLGPWWILITAIPTSLSGGMSTFFTGVFSYITDVTTESERSIRIAFLEASVLIAIIFGTLGGPYLYQLLGNMPLVGIVIGVNALAFLYTVVFIKESVTGAEQGNLSSVFDLSLVKDMAKTCVKKRPNKDRVKVFLLIGCTMLTVTFTGGLDYLYTRNKLQWSLETYSIFSVVSTVIRFVGLTIGIVVLQKLLKIGDIWLTMLSYLSAIAEYIIKAFAVVLWHMYLGAGVAVFRSLANPLSRSLLSKLLPAEDTAKIYSLLSIINVTVPLLAPLVFNPIYSATLDDFPGAIYIISAAINGLNFTMICIVKYYMWKYPSPPKENEEEKAEI